MPRIYPSTFTTSKKPLSGIILNNEFTTHKAIFPLITKLNLEPQNIVHLNQNKQYEFAQTIIPKEA